MLTTPDAIFDAAHSLGVRVEWADLDDDHGIYDHERRTITLHLCLTGVQIVSTAAHEYSHAFHRDEPIRDRREHDRRERRADVEAARMLISPEEYARAERLVGPDAGAIAEELGVSRWVVETFQREAGHGRGWTCTVARRAALSSFRG
ncbi:uncharacterized protein DUF955 [Salana multivorans]|uniref:Uncharacterized protein DUF955 n=1 Tax=Salana multivorans TaxID=120377 RepID=A0A3N2D2M8_9MICO|nr:ImmA/IrrE family metallo-endopeptidase [Salana multivorans]ROR94020.1 uncharacterized protein DUF955 [Salana multivorans]ROR97843.1 uncharacterized protein DUF955 [Salana multivorans]